MVATLEAEIAVHQERVRLAAHFSPALEDLVPNPSDKRLKEAVEHEGCERASDDGAGLGRFLAAAVMADVRQSPPSEALDEYDQNGYSIEIDDGVTPLPMDLDL